MAAFAHVLLQPLWGAGPQCRSHALAWVSTHGRSHWKPLAVPAMVSNLGACGLQLHTWPPGKGSPSS